MQPWRARWELTPTVDQGRSAGALARPGMLRRRLLKRPGTGEGAHAPTPAGVTFTLPEGAD
jgi:hypothetical protein